MNIRKTCFILFFACIPIHHVFSQIDKEFWFAAPKVTFSNSGGQSFLRFSSLGKSALVTLSVPSDQSIIPISVTVPANGTNFIDVTSLHSKILATIPDNVLNAGIKIESTEPVNAFYEYSTFLNSEIYSLKGKNALGNQFTIVSQNFWENSQNITPRPKNGFLIVASEDGTIVNINPSRNIVGHTQGTTFNILLNKGQVYYAEASGILGSDHLYGSNVSSTKPVAITTFDDNITSPFYGSCRDLIGDQLVPDERAGTEFIAVKGYLNNADKVFIIATQNNTNVFDNGLSVATLQKGQIFSIDVNTSNYIRTSLPSFAYHVTGTGCEVGSAILAPLNCTGTQNVGFTRIYKGQFGLILIVKKGGENDFTISNSGIAKSIASNLFVPVQGTGGGWMAANVNYDTLNVIPNQGYIVENKTSSFHLGIVDGFENNSGASYANFSNFSNLPISTTNTSPVCLNTSLSITVLSPTTATYNWIRPNGIKISDTVSNTLTIPSAAVQDSGVYLVQARQNGCLSPWDTVKVKVNSLPKAAVVIRNATCTNGIAQNNASIELYNGMVSDTNFLKYDFVRNNSYNGNKTYTNAIFLGQSSTISNLPNPNVPTNYTIRFFTKHGCTFDTTVTITPINCFCSSAQLSIKEFPSDSSFSTGLGTIGSLDQNWETSSPIYSGNIQQNDKTLPLPNSPYIEYKKALIIAQCSSLWALPNSLGTSFNFSNWISGQYVPCKIENTKYVYRYYRKSFVLPCNCDGSVDYNSKQISISLDGYADNRVLAIFVNGKKINASNLPSSNTTFRPNNQINVNFNDFFKAGINYIEILIENGSPENTLAKIEGLLITKSKTNKSYFLTKPKTGNDFSQCYTIDSVDLVDATNSQKWSVLSSPKAITLNKYSGIAKGLSIAGKYSFLLTDTAINACSDTVIITVFDTPSPIPNDTILCQQTGNISLKANGNDLTWYTTQNGGLGTKTSPSFNTNIPNTVSRWVTQTVNACEGPRKEVKIEIKSLPALPTAKDTILCQQIGNISLNAIGNDLTWYTTKNGTVSTKIIPPFDTNIPDTVSKWVTQTVNACEGPRIEVKIEIKALPALPTTKDTILCQQIGNISLNAIGNDLTWYTTKTEVVGTKSILPFNTNIPDTISRWVSKTVNNCEGPRKEVKIEIRSLPALPATKDTILCQQTGNISLKVIGNDLTWYATQNGGLGTKISPSFNTNLPDTVSKWVTQTVNACEGPRQEVKLKIKALPALPKAKEDTTLCQQVGNITLSAIGNDLTWYTTDNGGVGTKINPPFDTNIPDTVSKWVTQTVSACEGPRKEVKFKIKALPELPSTKDTIFCIEATNSSSFFEAKGIDLNWYNSPISGIGSKVVLSYRRDIVGKTEVYVTQTVNGCESKPKYLFSEVLPTPNINILGTNGYSFCSKSKVKLKASGAVSYTWKLPSSELITEDSIDIPSFELLNSGSYIVTGVALNKCKAVAEITLKLKNLPSISSNPVTICEKDTLKLIANSSGNVIWKTPKKEKIVGNIYFLNNSKYSNSGIYKVISESSGCKDSIDVQVNVLNCPPIAKDDKYSIFSDERIVTNLNFHPINNDTDPNDSLQLKDFTILTSPSNGILTIEKDGNWQYKPNQIFEGTEILEYRICDQGEPVLCSTARIIIEVKKRPSFFPDIFSPNGDGVNDFYIIYFTDETIKASLYVYNRWGDLVYKSNDYKNNWSGTCEVGGCLGSELPVGTYFVISELSNGQKTSTYVTLSR